MSADRTWSVSAEWIIPADGTVHRRAAMRGKGGFIEAVGPEASVLLSRNHRDLGDLVILPGLVNAHTHLELTHLRGKLPARRPMPQWLYGLRSHFPSLAQAHAAVADGAAEALRTGTTTVGDVCHDNRAWRTLKRTPIRAVCFAEIMGIGPMTGGAIDRLKRSIRGCRATTRIRFGICPHAPYTTSSAVYRDAVALARKKRWPLMTHLAETESERQLLRNGSGRFLDFLLHMGLMDSSVHFEPQMPMEFAQQAGLLDGPAALLHCNFIDDRELKLLAESSASVVCCPRSNDFFGGRPHRYAEMLAAGVNVAVGTDSLASNVSLDLFGELRRLRVEGRVDNHTILKMGTINAARAIGFDDAVGSLEPGKRADWIAVEVPHDSPAPLEDILVGKGRVVEVHINGKPISGTP